MLSSQDGADPWKMSLREHSPEPARSIDMVRVPFLALNAATKGGLMLEPRFSAVRDLPTEQKECCYAEPRTTHHPPGRYR